MMDFEAKALEIGLPIKYIPKLLNSFVSESTTQMERCDIAIDELNYEQIERSMHSIKGCAGNMRFESVASIAQASESASRLKDDTFDYRTNYINLRKEIEILNLEIKKALKEPI